LKKWRIAYMTKQQKEMLSKANSDAAPPIEAVLSKIKEHEKILTDSCKVMPERTAEAQKELKDIEDVFSNMKQENIGATGSSGSATGSEVASSTGNSANNAQSEASSSSGSSSAAATDSTPASNNQ
jgi:hypothetical protein